MAKQTLSIEQMHHLQELGLGLKETMMYWTNNHKEKQDWYMTRNPVGRLFADECLPAYTLQDMLDALPKYYHIANIGWTKLSIRIHTTKEWEIGYVYTDELSKYAYGCRILGKELIDAAYELFCWCVEWGFVETNKNE